MALTIKIINLSFRISLQDNSNSPTSGYYMKPTIRLLVLVDEFLTVYYFMMVEKKTLQNFKKIG